MTYANPACTCKYLMVPSKSKSGVNHEAGTAGMGAGIDDKGAGIDDMGAGIDDMGAGVDDKGAGIDDKGAGTGVGRYRTW